jgi:nucleoside-diphosphate-sugar epimerase
MVGKEQRPADAGKMAGRLFIFGLGYSGLEIAKLAKASGWTVAGTCTSPEKAERLRAEGVDAHLFDGSAAIDPEALTRATHVLCTIAPQEGRDPALSCRDAMTAARWLGYLSTTGVYGDHGGGWVDEATAAAPTQARSKARFAVETAWHAQRRGVPVDIFRLPGIYGPGRSAIDQVKAGTARRIDKPGQAFSRIHLADLAATVLAAMDRPSAGTIYNVADDLPASTADVVAFACELLGRPPPPLMPWAEAAPTMSAMARSFYEENRRVRNDRIKRALGVTLRYPTYREGLRAIAAQT